MYFTAAASASSVVRAASILLCSRVTDLPSLSNAPAESSIETRDINRTVLQLHDKEAGEDVGFIQLNVLDLMSRGVDKVGKQEIYDAWAAFSKALDDNSVAGI